MRKQKAGRQHRVGPLPEFSQYISPLSHSLRVRPRLGLEENSLFHKPRVLRTPGRLLGICKEVSIEHFWGRADSTCLRGGLYKSSEGMKAWASAGKGMRGVAEARKEGWSHQSGETYLEPEAGLAHCVSDAALSTS